MCIIILNYVHYGCLKLWYTELQLSIDIRFEEFAIGLFTGARRRSHIRPGLCGSCRRLSEGAEH